MRAEGLTLGGLAPFTTIDFPGKLAAVLFCQGCPWRCGYCHNPQLLDFGPGHLSWAEARAFLEARRGLLEAVVFSGGEPLAQDALPAALRESRALGYAVGLHTAGPGRQRLARVLDLVDWVGFDLKAPFARYREVAGAAGGRGARASLQALLASGVAHEVRTTVDARWLDGAALEVMAGELAALGVRHWVLQRSRSAEGGPPQPLDDAALVARLASSVEQIELRGF